MNACSAACGWCGRCTASGDEPSFRATYRCLDCVWTGQAANAYDHHRQDHHQIEIVQLGVIAPFACCDGSQRVSDPALDVYQERRRI